MNNEVNDVTPAEAGLMDQVSLLMKDNVALNDKITQFQNGFAVYQKQNADLTRENDELKKRVSILMQAVNSARQCTRLLNQVISEVQAWAP